MAMEKRAPELIRVYVSEDRRVKAQFSDNSLIVLDSGGGAFVHCCPQGSRVRQLTHFAVSRFEEKLASVLKFRNMHLAEPFYCQWLTKNHSQERVFTSGYIIRSVRWPKSFQEGIGEGCIECLDGGSIMVRSEDGWAQVVMHPSRQRFAVCYPLLLATEKTEKFQYVWHTQVFSISQYPSRWTWVIELVLEAVEENLILESTERQGTEACVRMDDESDRTSESRDGELSSVEGGSLTRTSDLPVNAEPHPSTCHASEIPDSSWWFEPTTTILPKTEAITVEWSSQATYQYIVDKREVEVWVHSDESCVFTCKGGRFFRHIRQPLAEDRMYASSSISPMLRSSEGGTAMAIGKIAKRALKLRDSALRNLGPMCSLKSAPHPISNEILEEQEIPGHGKFTAYEDGRVRIRFDDRTMLNMDAAHENCVLILPTGKRMEVRVDLPIGVKAYVDSALEFADWAFKTPAERGETLKARMEIEAEAERCALAAKICDWALYRKLPKECTEELGPAVNAPKDDEGVTNECNVEVGGGSDSWERPDFGEQESILRDVVGECHLGGKGEDMVEAWLMKTSVVLDKMSL